MVVIASMPRVEKVRTGFICAKRFDNLLLIFSRE